MNIETKIKLNKFVFRSYQAPILDAIENKGYKKVLLNWSRRSGKDCTAFNIILRAALKKVGVYFYCLPTYNQGRKVIWDGILSNGQRFLDFIPQELITGENGQEMKLTLFNGSIIQIVGSDTASQSLVGTNPQAVVFSEWALADKSAYQFIRPALMYNNGFALFISTPRGRNHFYELHEIARNSPEWFVSTKTVLDTGHISLAEIEKERQTMSEDMIQQEFFCFPGNQTVKTRQRKKRFLKEVYKPISEIKIGEVVMTHTGKWRRVLDVISREYSGQILKIKFASIRKNLVCTPDHLILVHKYLEYDPFKNVWIRAQDLKPETDFIACPMGPRSMCNSKIYSITEKPFTGLVYNLKVEEDESYIVEDCAVHNCSFSAGVEGSYYGRYIDRMRLEGRIGDVPWEPTFKVFTSWDLGVSDPTCIIFYQRCGQTIRIIDYYENIDKGLDHYAKILSEKPYTYGGHFAPHDIRVRELGSTGGLSRLESAARLGIKFNVLPNLPIEDGIEATRVAMAKWWVDERKCEKLLKALEAYRREYDSKRDVYKDNPLHDWSSHACFVGDTLIKTPKGDVAIKDIKVGDEVVTPLGIRKVLSLHPKKVTTLCRILTRKGKIVCTPEHEIFTQRGIVYADSLRYHDVIENYSKTRIKIWRMIFGYFSAVDASKGFKKIILSRRMKNPSSLMDIFIDGTDTIIKRPLLRSTRLHHFIEQFGLKRTVKFLRCTTSTIKMAILKIMPSKISNVLLQKNISENTPQQQTHGLNQSSVKKNYECYLLRQLHGIRVKMVEDGTKNMPSKAFRGFVILPMTSNVRTVSQNSRPCLKSRNTALMHVERGLGFVAKSIMRIAIALFVRAYSAVISMCTRKHAVTNVVLYSVEKPEQVYDLTIEQDNCYYANNYLVSNSDCARYLALSLPKTADGLSSEEIQRNYEEACYGNQAGFPSFFRDTERY
jgi:hypothetical protein